MGVIVHRDCMWLSCGTNDAGMALLKIKPEHLNL
jgi:hypothetical protein